MAVRGLSENRVELGEDHGNRHDVYPALVPSSGSGVHEEGLGFEELRPEERVVFSIQERLSESKLHTPSSHPREGATDGSGVETQGPFERSRQRG